MANEIFELEELKQITLRLEYTIRATEIIENVEASGRYQRIANLLTEIMDCEHAAFGYIDSNKSAIYPGLAMPQMMEACQVRGQDIVFTKEQTLKMAHWSKLYQKKAKPFYDNDPNNFKIPTGHVIIKNLLLCPVIRDGKLIATIGLANKHSGFNNSDLETISKIADHIARYLF